MKAEWEGKPSRKIFPQYVCWMHTVMSEVAKRVNQKILYAYPPSGGMGPDYYIYHADGTYEKTRPPQGEHASVNPAEPSLSPVEWTECEMFTASNGVQCFRWAVSDKLGVKFEMTQHDETVKKMVTQSEWVAADTAPTINAKIDYIQRGFRVLIGYGRRSDPAGNLALMQLTTTTNFDSTRMMEMIARVLAMLAGMGIKLDKHALQIIRGN